MELNTLSIRLSTDGFSFSIYSPIHSDQASFFERPVNETQTLTLNFKHLLQSEEMLQQSYNRINLLIADQRYTLLPEELYDKSEFTSIFYLNHPRSGEEKILCDHLEQSRLYVLFSVEETLYRLLRENYPEARICAHITPLCEYFCTQSRLGNNRKLYINFRTHSIDMFCFERDRLLLLNTFEYKQHSDAIYYILYVWKQIGLDQQRDELHLSGEMQQKLELMKELKRYIRQVYIMQPEKNLDFQSITTLYH